MFILGAIVFAMSWRKRAAKRKAEAKNVAKAERAPEGERIAAAEGKVNSEGSPTFPTNPDTTDPLQGLIDLTPGPPIPRS
jgi:hypothetical protein